MHDELITAQYHFGVSSADTTGIFCDLPLHCPDGDQSEDGVLGISFLFHYFFTNHRTDGGHGIRKKARGCGEK